MCAMADGILADEAAAATCAAHLGALAQGGHTALMEAARHGHADCARLLLDAGADKEAKDCVRASPGADGWRCMGRWRCGDDANDQTECG